MTEHVRFDTEQAFDEDYLFFYEPLLTDELSDRQTGQLWDLLALEEGAEVLDLACGHGRIANRLAARGARVTGLDATPLFLERARAEAAELGVDVDYVEGDMRELPWDGRFDAACCVFTAFGYFDDADNRRVLEEVRAALRPGGRFWLDVNHLPWIAANYRDVNVSERDGQYMIDRNRFDVTASRNITTRTVLRDGEQRGFQMPVRMFTFTELRDWLLAAGFSSVDGYDTRGEELTLQSPRMLLIAHA